MSQPLLSILTPAVPSRLDKLNELTAQIEMQRLRMIMDRQWSCLPVEHLIFLDNKARRVGAKRQGLIDLARGEYVAFVDDDDTISPHYIAKLLEAIQRRPDVVTFQQHCTVDGHEGIVDFDLQHHFDRHFTPGGITQRRPWHICAWRRELAIQGIFPEIDYGEDASWVNQVFPLAKTQIHIPEILHYYRHSRATTEAPPPLAS